MELTRKQEEGLKIAVERYRNHEPYTCISGFAGTGKTTLVRFIISALQLYPSQVKYIAYTGKAAQVLVANGNLGATTAHKFMYHSRRNERTGKFYHILKKPWEVYPTKLIVVDEVSMFPKDMWEQLLTFRIPIIALGDPAQLPPVLAESNGILEHPQIFLDEVMRQAKDSEIIRLTMDIREQKPLELFNGEDVKVVDSSELMKEGIWLWPDQIIVAKNMTRKNVNNSMRKFLYNTDDPFPIEGDRIICLKNNWLMLNDDLDALVNGLDGTISNIRPDSNRFAEKVFKADFYPNLKNACPFGDIQMDELIFTKGTKSRNMVNPTYPIPKDFAPEQFDYGYAITCHKSQGSQYDKVLVLEEFMRGDNAESHSKWLYTAATRASKKLIIVRNY